MANKNYFKVKNGLEFPSQDSLSVTDNGGPSIRPSLNIDFVNTKQLDPRITYSRASTGVYYDGTTQVVAEQNLLLNSQAMTISPWGSASTLTGTADTTVAPDGTTTADTLTAVAGGTYHYNQQPSVNNLATGYATFSCFLKAGTSNYGAVRLAVDGGNNRYGVVVDLSLGIVTSTTISGTITGNSYTITAVGSGWYRVSVTALIVTAGVCYGGVAISNSATPSFTAGYPSWSAAGTESIIAWGAQLEQRSQMSQYTPTTSTAVNNYIPVLSTAPINTPRFDHDPITGESKGLLLEGSRTGLVYHTETFESPLWAKTRVSVMPVGVVTPNGSISAYKLIEDTSAATSHYMYMPSAALINGSYYTFSAYVKSAERTACAISFYTTNGTFPAASAYFNLATGTAGTKETGIISSNIVDCGNGWYRISATSQATSNLAGNISLTLCATPNSGNYTGDGKSGIYVWAVQLENGANASSQLAAPTYFLGRGTPGYYRGDDGYLTLAPANTARYELNYTGGRTLLIENATKNYILNSDRLSTAFSTLGTSGIMVSNAAIAPDNSLTATLLTGPTSGSSFYQDVYNIPSVGTANLTGSVYIKAAGNSSYIALSLFALNNSIESSSYQFNPVTGAIGASSGTGNPANPVATSVGNGWWRISFSRTGTNALNTYIRFQIYLQFNTGIYVWGAQLESGSAVTSYIPSLQSFNNRSSAAYYFDAGSTALAENNLITYSQDFDNGAWFKSACSITANTAVAPDGTTTADTLTFSAVSSNACVASAALTVRQGGTYTKSVYVKYISQQFIQLPFAGTPFGAAYVNFDIVNGTITKSSLATGTISYVGNGWYRISATATASTSSSTEQIWIWCIDSGLSGYANASTSSRSLYVWGAQEEYRFSASNYVPTTSAAITTYAPRLIQAAANTVRYDYDPVTRKSKGLLQEAVSTNLINNSHDMNVGTGTPNWYRGGVLSQVTVVSNSTIAPDGTQTAQALIPRTSATSNPVVIHQSTVTANKIHTLSVYVKSLSGYRLRLQLNEPNYTNGYYINFDPVTGTVTNPTAFGAASYTNYTVENAGNGWWRISVTALVDTTSTSLNSGFYVQDATGAMAYTPSGYSGIFLWGPQLEQNFQPTSYIPTPGNYIGRTSTATYLGSDGLIKTANIDTLRYESVALGTVSGLSPLYEGYKVNMLDQTTNVGWSGWGKNANSLVVPNTMDVQAPDGSYSASKILTVTTGTVGVWHPAVTITTSTTYTVSAFFKKGSAAYFLIGFSDNVSAGANAFINATTLAVTPSPFGGWSVGSNPITVTPYPNGWYRISFTATSASTGTSTTMHVEFVNAINNTGTAGEYGYVWGAQFEGTPVSTSYIPSTESFTSRSSVGSYYGSDGTLRIAGSNQPRYSYNPNLLGNPPSLLIENASTNMLPYSSPVVAAQGTNPGWQATSANATVTFSTSYGTLAASGEYYAQFVSSTNGDGLNITSYTPTYSASKSFTGSVYWKNNGGANAVRFDLILGNTNQRRYAVGFTFDGLNYTVTNFGGALTDYSAAAQYVGNGWWRLSLTGNTGTGTQPSGVTWLYVLAASATSHNAYVYGAQIEENAAGASSYIPTAGASATRAADVFTSLAGIRYADTFTSPQVSRAADSVTSSPSQRAADDITYSYPTRASDISYIGGTNFSSWYRQDEGTLLREFAINDTGLRTVIEPGYATTLFNSSAPTTNHFAMRVVHNSNSTCYIDSIIRLHNSTIVDGDNGATFSNLYGVKVKQVLAVKPFNVSAAYTASDGSTALPATTFTPPQLPIPDTLSLMGDDGTTIARGSAYLRKLQYYPKRLTNTELTIMSSV